MINKAGILCVDESLTCSFKILEPVKHIFNEKFWNGKGLEIDWGININTEIFIIKIY